MCVLDENSYEAHCLPQLPKDEPCDWNSLAWFCLEDISLTPLLQDNPWDGWGQSSLPSFLTCSSLNMVACSLWLIQIPLKVRHLLGWPPPHWKTQRERETVFFLMSVVGRIQGGGVPSSFQPLPSHTPASLRKGPTKFYRHMIRKRTSFFN